MSEVALRNVAKSFGAVQVIHDLSLAIERGRLLVLVGPSGCGKTTVIRLIAGLEQPDRGEILIDGRVVNDVHPRDRDIAMVFQNYALYPDKTAYENMAFALRMRAYPAAEIDSRVRQAASVLGMSEYLDRKPRELSGGQRQRVAVGRAMVRNPKVFLFDEPLSNLDAHLRVHMRTEIVRLHQKLAATMIYVTHDQIEAMTMGDVIAVLDRGRVMQVGSPLELYRRPANVFVARFIGSPMMNLLPAEQMLRGGQAPARNLLFGIRPEDVRLTEPSPQGLVGIIDVVEQHGAQTQISVELESGNLTALVPANDRLAVGDRVGIAFNMENAHFFETADDQRRVRA